MAPLPYVTSSGNIEKAFLAIKSAAVPERVNQDFVKTVLKIPGSSGNEMTAYLKKLGFSSSDGTPTARYSLFRNPSTSGQAVFQAMKDAYSPVFKRNEYAHKLTDEKLTALIMDETGHSHDSSQVKYSSQCFKALRRFADFTDSPDEPNDIVIPPKLEDRQEHKNQENRQKSQSVGLNLGYTINLNLPATSDQAVFNAIFKSLKQHLLSDDDA